MYKRQIFESAVPESWGDLTLITTGGVEADTLTGYNTVYRQEGQTVWLSNDGSVYQEPVPMPEPEPYDPPLSDLQAAKKSEIDVYKRQDADTGDDGGAWVCFENHRG